MTEPSPNGDNGRDSGGRFAAGNAGGPGNPFARQVAAWRSAVMEAVTAEDMRAVVGELVRQAKAGEAWAVKELMYRTLGKPIDVDLLERLEQLEAAVEKVRTSRIPGSV